MSTQALVDVMNQAGAFRIIQGCISIQQTACSQLLFKELIAIIGERHVACFFVQLEVLIRQRWNNGINGDVHLGTIIRRAGNNKRRTGFINQDTVDFIHDRKIVFFLENLAQLGFHIIAKIIKAQFIVGRVGNV